MTYLAAATGFVSIFGQEISAWTIIMLLLGIVIGFILRGKVG